MPFYCYPTKREISAYKKGFLSLQKWNMHIREWKKKWEEIYSHFEKCEVKLLGVEEEVEFKFKHTAGVSSYVQRNQAIIDASDYCVFYYDESYKPELRKRSKNSLNFYQPKSGTRLAYNYAMRKKKKLINIINL